jgi:acetyl esterase/lipase
MRLSRGWRRCLGGLGLLGGAAALTAAWLWWYFNPAFTRSGPLPYGERAGQPLTLEVIQPARPRGLGVVVLNSGSWKSRPASFDPRIAAALLRRGYTLFVVSHRSQPEATVPEIVADVQRAVRFIRVHAAEHGVNPARLGVTGGSSGGHLSLMLASRGGPGDPAAAEPVARASSAVQAVAIFFPVTDLLNLGKSSENASDGGPPKSFVKAFGPDVREPGVWPRVGREVSPIYHVTTNLPPVLILHGTADTLTPLEQSEWFRDRAAAVGRPVELILRPGKKHGWLTMAWDIRRFADWFDQHLGAP